MQQSIGACVDKGKAHSSVLDNSLLALQDDLFRIFGGDRLQSMMNMFQARQPPADCSVWTVAAERKQMLCAVM